MADDIDIEEHDVMDNPRIRQILPSLQLDVDIKTEAPDDDYETEDVSRNNIRDALSFENDVGEEGSNYVEVEIDSPRLAEAERHGNHDERQQIPEPAIRHKESEEYVVRNNKIILGNKPVSSQTSNANQSLVFGFNHLRHIKTEPLDYYEEEDEEIEDNRVTSHTPVMILGSKPNRDHEIVSDEINRKTNQKTTEIARINLPTYLTVYLEDWGPRLERSRCYCKECQTLFPTRNCLDAHKMAAHSFLVALDTNVAIKSTSKGHDFKSTQNESGIVYKNTARKSTQHEPSTSKAKVCNHCNKIFADDTALIKHLYEFFTSDNEKKKIKCEICHDNFTNGSELQLHMATHEDHEMEEDGGEDGNLFFRCHICGCYLKLYTFFERHMNDNHKCNVIETQRVPFDPKCIRCDKISELQNHNRHVQCMHIDYYLMDSKTYEARKNLPIDVPEPMFRCHKCNKTFASYGEARRHRRFDHVGAENVRIFSKITKSKAYERRQHKVPLTKTLVQRKVPLSLVSKKVSANNVKVSNNDVTYDQIIPKDVLFRCHCLVNFIYYSAACVHAYKCSKSDRSVSESFECQYCKRSIAIENQSVHQMQHKLTEQFKVYNVNERVYSKILCKCPNCKFYFNEQDLWEHWQKGCGNSQCVKCNECDIFFGQSSIEAHRKMHRTLNITVNDLVLVDYVKTSEINLRKRTHSEAELGNDMTELKSNDKKRPVYYCNKCKICSFKVKDDIHTSGKCAKMGLVRKICKSCGVAFRSAKHPRFHESYPDVKLQDFKFLNLHTRKLIPAPIPDYPRCNKCSVHFISAVAQLKHECNDHYQTCPHCNKKFSDLALKLHLPLHTYKINGSNKKAKPAAIALQKLSNSAEDMPELLKKYEQLTNIWNFLYVCKDCDVACDSYDKMVEHSQDHFCKPDKDYGVIKECKKCDLKFDSVSFKNHLDLHNANKRLNNSNFKIINYDYTKLFTEQWHDVFNSLPKTQVEGIVSTSIYQHTRGLRMHIINNKKSHYKMYKCGRCGKFLHPQTLTVHHKMAQCTLNVNKNRCVHCKIPFSSYAANVEHMKEHKKLGIRTKLNCTVVLINKPGDENYNKVLQQLDAITKVPEWTKLSKKKFSLSLFSCKKCKTCMKGDIRKHRCIGRFDTVQCSECTLKFKSVSLKKHMKMHNEFPNLSRADIGVIVFDPDTLRQCPMISGKDFLKTQSVASSTVKKASSAKSTSASPVKTSKPETTKTKGKVSPIFRCKCGLHFTSHSLRRRHANSCDPNNLGPSENCSQCGLLFPTDILVNHLCRDHAGAGTKVKVIKDSFTLLKCKKCIPCFMSPKTIVRHMKTNHKMPQLKQCHQCGLTFSRNCYKRHISKHHGKNEDGVDRFELKEFIGSKLVGIKSVPISKKKYVKKVVIKQEKEEDIPITPAIENQISANEHSAIQQQLRGPDLYKCQRCELHLMANDFFCKHRAMRCHETTIPSEKCPVCGLLLYSQHLKKHLLVHHERMKLKLSDLYVVPRDPLGRKLLSKYELSGRVKSDLNTANYGKELFNCIKCDLSFINRKTFDTHNCDAVQRFGCEVCGYMFTAHTLARHHEIHHVRMKLNREDFRIFTLNQRGSIKNRLAYEDSDAEVDDLDKSKDKSLNVSPAEEEITETPKETNKSNDTDAVDIQYVESDMLKGSFGSYLKHISTLFKCNKCSTYFVDVISCQKHIKAACNYESKKCVECGYKFGLDMRKHVRIHHIENKLNIEDFQIVQFCFINSKLVTNCLFKCGRCFKNYLSESAALDHSCEFKINLKKRCSTCDFTFNSEDLKHHTSLHHEAMKLDRDFQIIMCISDEKMDDNDDDTSVCRDSYLATVDWSLYSNNVWNCGKCGIHLLAEDMLKIHQTKCRSNTNKTSCRKCDLEFSQHAVALHEYVHHKMMNLERVDIKVVVSEGTDADTDSDLLDSSIKIEIGRYRNVLFKCNLCSLHFLREGTVRSHNHRTRGFKCKVCDLKFSERSLFRHEAIHHGKLKLNPDDFDIRVFSEKGILIRTEKGVFNKTAPELDSDALDCSTDDVSTKSKSPPPSLKKETIDKSYNNKNTKIRKYTLQNFVKIALDRMAYDNRVYKCKKCTLHYLDEDSARKHESCCDSSVRAIPCDVCGVEFSYITLEKHMYVHHEKMGLRKSDIVEADRVNKNLKTKIYKCADCATHFIDEGALDCHITNYAHKIIKKPCKVCNLQFGLQSLNSHFLAHHKDKQLDLNDFEIIMKNENGETSIVDDKLADTDVDTSVKEKVTDPNVPRIFKCAECDVYFNTMPSFNKHMSPHKKLDTKEYIDCKLCSLPFKILSLQKHVQTHHVDGFDFDNLLIVEFVPKNDSFIRTNTYFVKDKIQSKLISTTSDINTNELKDKKESNCNSEADKDVECEIKDKGKSNCETEADIDLECEMKDIGASNFEDQADKDVEREIKDKTDSNIEKELDSNVVQASDNTENNSNTTQNNSTYNKDNSDLKDIKDEEMNSVVKVNVSDDDIEMDCIEIASTKSDDNDLECSEAVSNVVDASDDNITDTAMDCIDLT